MAHSKKCVESCLELTRILCDMDIGTFLTKLSDFDDDRNYAVFMAFAEICSSNMLAVLFRSGYFVGHCEMLRIAGKIIESRNYPNEDVDGHIAFLLLSYHHMLENVKSKFLFVFFIIYYKVSTFKVKIFF